MPQQKSIFRYIGKGVTWGLWLQITANDILFDDYVPRNKIVLKVSEHIYLSIDKNLGTNVVEYLYNAVTINQSKLNEILAQPTIIDIVALEIAHSDYQDEAMYFGMIKWLNDRYMLGLDFPEIHFEQLKNRYVTGVRISIRYKKIMDTMLLIAK